jgi:hypothetical protein
MIWQTGEGARVAENSIENVALEAGKRKEAKAVTPHHDT